jgi:hypothetical protein
VLRTYLGTPMLSVALLLETSMPFYLFSPLISTGLSWHVLISNYSSFGSLALAALSSGVIVPECCDQSPYCQSWQGQLLNPAYQYLAWSDSHAQWRCSDRKTHSFGSAWSFHEFDVALLVLLFVKLCCSWLYFLLRFATYRW